MIIINPLPWARREAACAKAERRGAETLYLLKRRSPVWNWSWLWEKLYKSMTSHGLRRKKLYEENIRRTQKWEKKLISMKRKWREMRNIVSGWLKKYRRGSMKTSRLEEICLWKATRKRCENGVGSKRRKREGAAQYHLDENGLSVIYRAISLNQQPGMAKAESWLAGWPSWRRR